MFLPCARSCCAGYSFALSLLDQFSIHAAGRVLWDVSRLSRGQPSFCFRLAAEECWLVSTGAFKSDSVYFGSVSRIIEVGSSLRHLSRADL